MVLSSAMIQKIYQKLFKAYGPQNWWPAEDRFEIMVGAILTQNTNWTNVERALEGLRQGGCLSPDGIRSCPDAQLAWCIRPSGYFNVKAKRLKAFCNWFVTVGGLDALDTCDTELLRQELLSVHGIGPETADDILLYAFDRPVFVVDAYTLRIFSRLGQVEADTGYEPLRAFFEQGLGDDVPLFNEYHALIVRHGKEVCRPKPVCSACVLSQDCEYDAGEQD
jgi:endonuclease-3 related protein